MVLDVNHPEAVPTARTVLAKGGVAVLPTDTIYGFSGIVPDTEERIRSLKGRGEDKPFLMLIGDPEWIRTWSDFTVPEALYRFWPGPLTLIVPGRRAGETHAFRQPDHPFLSAVLAGLERPLYSTSVNLSSRPFKIVRQGEIVIPSELLQ
jgi:L-threonylcarbamoyladenylate synthase